MFLVTVALSFGLCMASPQPVAVQPAVTLDAKVAGRVVDAVSRRPIADATVILVPTVQQFPAGAINTTAITDANGQFSIQPLPSGRYHVYVRKTGFARVPDAANAQTIDVGSGQSVTDIELALHAGASIAGRVLDASGRPAPLLTVSALREVPRLDTTTVPTTAPAVQTNDRGEFRLDDLDAGSYLVIAAPSPRPFAPPRPGAMASAPTYYPGTRDRRTAQMLTVVAGQIIDDLRFSLVLLPAHEVSGVVTDEAGLPLAGIIVLLTSDPMEVGTATPATGQTDQDGAFRLGGIVSGSYHVRAAGGGSPAAVGGVFLGSAASVEITVGDTDVTGLRIVVPTRR